MMVGLLLSILGVDETVIAEDYALSDFESRDPAGYRAALDRVTAAGFDPEVLRTRPETICGFLDGVCKRVGDAEALARLAGASATTIESVRANLLEPSPHT